MYCVYKVWVALGTILCGVSVLTSATISVDRLLALLLGLRYKDVVTFRRVRVVISSFWLFTTLVGFLRAPTRKPLFF